MMQELLRLSFAIVPTSPCVIILSQPTHEILLSVLLPEHFLVRLLFELGEEILEGRRDSFCADLITDPI